MTSTRRSRKAQRAQLVAELRTAGHTWAQVAARIGADERVGTLTAFRLAHGLSQQEVADQWNSLLHDDQGDKTLTDKQISYWETWPQGGREPSLSALKRLARIYQCNVRDLLEDGDFSHLDEATNGLVGKPAAPSPNTRASEMAMVRGMDEGIITGKPLKPPTAQLPDGLAESLLRHSQSLLTLDHGHVISARQRDSALKQLIQFLIDWACTMERRELLRILSWATSAAIAAPALNILDPDEQERLARVIESSSRVDETVIGHIEEVLQRCLRQDDTLGPQAALDTVLAQRSLVSAMLPECPVELRPRLLSAYSDFTRTAGWLSFNLNDFDSAWHYYELARTSAHEAQNTALGSFVLCQMSHLAAWENRPRVAIDHAVAAQGWADRTDDARLRAYAAQVAARGYAMEEGQASQSRCRQELERAEIYLDDDKGNESILHFNDRAQLLSDQSQCFLRHNDTETAAAKARESLNLRDRSFVRNRAFTTLFLGRSYLQSGEIESAATFISDAVELAFRNRSTRVMEEVNFTLRDLNKWKDVKDVRELLDRYHTLAKNIHLRTAHTKG